MVRIYIFDVNNIVYENRRVADGIGNVLGARRSVYGVAWGWGGRKIYNALNDCLCIYIRHVEKAYYNLLYTFGSKL